MVAVQRAGKIAEFVEGAVRIIGTAAAADPAFVIPAVEGRIFATGEDGFEIFEICAGFEDGFPHGIGVWRAKGLCKFEGGMGLFVGELKAQAGVIERNVRSVSGRELSTFCSSARASSSAFTLNCKGEASNGAGVSPATFLYRLSMMVCEAFIAFHRVSGRFSRVKYCA